MAVNPVPFVITHFNVFLDGRMYAGIAKEVELPKLTMKFEDANIGDMPYPTEGGMEKMTATIKFAEWERSVITTFGVRASGPVSFVLKAVQKKDVPIGVTVELRGYVSELDMGNLSSGDGKNELKIEMRVTYYKYSVLDKTLIEIDPVNFVRNVGGEDQLAAVRAMLLR